MKEDEQPSSTSTLPVIIVGAGASGLAAAQRLSAQKVKVIVIEGRGRIGGRINTVTLAGDSSTTEAHVDMGAFWVDGGPDHNSVYQMATEQAGLTLIPSPYLDNPMEVGREHRVYDAANQGWTSWWRINWYVLRGASILAKLFGGTSTSHNNLQERLDNIYEASWWLTPNKYDRFLAETPLTLMNAAPLSTLHPNTENPGYFHIHDEYDQGTEFRVVGGYTQLVNYLETTLAASHCQVLLGETVTSITTTIAPSTVTVQTSNGNAYTGSHVIVTVPLAVLKDSNNGPSAIRFEPPLPEPKRDAIERLGVGTLEKVAMTFKDTFWRADKSRAQNVYFVPLDSDDDEAGFPAFVDATDDVRGGAPTLVAFTAIPKSQQQVRDGTALAIIERMLQTMFPHQDTRPLSTATTQWETDPFSLGSYSCLATITQPGDMEALAQPFGRVLFAGEATSTRDAPPGYVESAILSGYREASRILDEVHTS